MEWYEMHMCTSRLCPFNLFSKETQNPFSDAFGFKLIPLKLVYYQTFFETWRNEHSWYEFYSSRDAQCNTKELPWESRNFLKETHP